MPKRRQENGIIPASQQDINNAIKEKQEIIIMFQNFKDQAEKEIRECDERLKNVKMNVREQNQLREYINDVLMNDVTTNQRMIDLKQDELERLRKGSVYVHDKPQNGYDPMDMGNPYIVSI